MGINQILSVFGEFFAAIKDFFVALKDALFSNATKARFFDGRTKTGKILDELKEDIRSLPPEKNNP